MRIDSKDLDPVAPQVTENLSLMNQPLESALSRVREAFAAYVSGDHEKTTIKILETLAFLDSMPSLLIGHHEKIIVGQTLASILEIFCQPDLDIPEHLAFPLLTYNALIGNIMDGCLDTTTDSLLLRVSLQRQAVFKSLVLYSARNNQELDIPGLLVLNPDLVSRWLYQTWKVVFSGNCSEKVTSNLSRFLAQMDHRILPATDMQELYFGCTYPGIPEERRAKELVNQSIQKNIPVKIRNQPNPKKIAVFSEYWSKGHSVHRTLGKYIESLRGDFHVTLLHCIRSQEDLDTTMFDDVRRIEFNGSALNVSQLEGNDFSAVIFPDVGMTLPSILMVNMRIAPVQIMLTGHPVSTFGAHIDYFISGQEVDLPLIAKHNYSERLVLLPGYGAVHELPSYSLKGKAKSCSEVLINCSWYGQKIHWRCLDAVNEALGQCKQRVKLRIFGGNAPAKGQGYAAFLKEISKRMSNCWTECVPHLQYADYMELMEEGDFAIDVFPYAGSNTVADNMHLRKPTLVREGYRWFNRIGPAMLRSIGLEELIAVSDMEYKSKLIRLVDDVDYRISLSARLSMAELNDTVFKANGATEFAKFVRNVTSNQNFYPGDEPIVL
ncbi:MAG: hypothetical protein RL069_3023 [Planctomycetota bacterium]